ncbi:helix-turn-helix domain-containing protein [Roseateles toxinivorans]|uniref:Helix-turn-helix protein n=1 Tax=Roseateles toxinivorans TaxID=270368 RepID=A0A4R6QUA9_9BURK|nr:helix-turn-helix transcriptional regulator [Roseateles toxinivorans]TDP74753.1 helix-turn-helix protein [Roseateles toxinivorans]
MAGRPRKNPEFPPPPPETLGERLRDERVRLGLTQEHLAEILGVALSALQNYEQGRNTLKTPVLERLRRAKVDVDYVVYGRDAAALEPLDADLWERVKAWDAANPNDADGKPLNEYSRYQRVTLFYRWLREDSGSQGEVEERLSKLLRSRAA